MLNPKLGKIVKDSCKLVKLLQSDRPINKIIRGAKFFVAAMFFSPSLS